MDVILLHCNLYERWQERRKEMFLLSWNFKNGVHNFNSVLSLFEQWVTAALTITRE